MPYRLGLMIPTQWAGPAANGSRMGKLPYIAVPCPVCGHEAILKNREGFRCGYGHETRARDIEFACLKDGCKRTARLTLDAELDCGRHRVHPGLVFKCH